MPAEQKYLTTPSLAITSIPEVSVQYKACAVCDLRIPQEQTTTIIDITGLETCVVVCPNCRRTRQGNEQARPLHASERTGLTQVEEIPLPISLSEGISVPSPPSSSLEPEDRVFPGPSRLSQLSSPRESLHPISSPASISSTALDTHRTAHSTPRSEQTSKKNISTRAEPSPRSDITRLRVNRTGRNCLYPGSTFQGVQKSGRSDYDVTVTILDVDLATSFLCGYLEIRGLTEDWPELTTYFDAEIIGAQYSFLTRGWGATHEDDLQHWAQFPAFSSKEIQNDLQFPRYTLRDEMGRRQRSCLFMRWKERFLVPDHRVKDINGASFAGFYYICLDFEPSALSDAASDTGPPKGDLEPISASMSGFYFHNSSERYQQLSLHHVPDEVTGMGNGTFEWR